MFGKKSTKKFIFAIFIILVAFASILEINENKGKLKNKFAVSVKNDSNTNSYEDPKDLENDKGRKLAFEWSQKILKGGYILYFRHAERDKWQDVQIYDALESKMHDNDKNNTTFAENTYFAKAVCLNTRGQVQVKGMREVIGNAAVPIGLVISSPSCRARQTAKGVFGGYDKLDKILIHKGPFYENINERNKKLKKFFISLPIKKENNTIITAHGGVIDNSLFSNVVQRASGGPKLKIEEGGFFVISNKNGKLFLEYKFNKFHHFSRNFFPR